MKLPAEPLLTGLGMLFASAALTPMLKSATKPLVSCGMAGATVAGIETRKKCSFLREEFEDFMAEVQFERQQKRVSRVELKQD